MKTDNATPRPWYLVDGNKIYRRPQHELYEYGGGVAGDRFLAKTDEGWHGKDDAKFPHKENAALIVKAVNHYEQLVESLKAMMLIISNTKDMGGLYVNLADLSQIDQANELLTKLKEDEK